MTDIKKLLAGNIKAIRKERGFSQAQLAEKAGIAARYLAGIETCESYPTPDTLERIAKALGTDTLDLFNIYPLQQDWKEMILHDISAVVDQKFKEVSGTVPAK